MRRILLVLGLLFLLGSFWCSGQIVIHIEAIPASTPEGAGIFFAGNINGWNPGDANYKLAIEADGDYGITLPSGSGTVQYKFTRGSWESVEGNESGSFRPNRSYTYGNGDTLKLSILSWEDLDGGGGNSTANAQVSIWDEAMFIPQLNRNRRVWVYLPQDYESSEKSYPVLYMHDGQNVFDASTAFAGEWEVDETLTKLENEGYETAIVIAIDNGGTHRIDEYSPFVNDEYGGGQGDAYLDFLIETLKPRVDSTFRTLAGPEHTGIMGSSMGGLISHYAYFRNPEVFGKMGIFSPAYWFSAEYFSYTENRGKLGAPRIYLLAGAQETSIAKGTEEMMELLTDLEFTAEEVKMVIEADGQHSEWFWAREFEAAFTWLFLGNNESGISLIERPQNQVYPNPFSDQLNIKGRGNMEVKVFSSLGHLLLSTQIQDEGSIDFSSIATTSELIVQLCQAGQQQSYRVIRL